MLEIVGADPGRNPYRVAWMFDGKLIGMEQLPRLISGNCPNCSSTEIIVKMIHPDDRAVLAATAQKALAELGSFSSEFRVVTTDG